MSVWWKKLSQLDALSRLQRQLWLSVKLSEGNTEGVTVAEDVPRHSFCLHWHGVLTYFTSPRKRSRLRGTDQDWELPLRRTWLRRRRPWPPAPRTRCRPHGPQGLCTQPLTEFIANVLLVAQQAVFSTWIGRSSPSWWGVSCTPPALCRSEAGLRWQNRDPRRQTWQLDCNKEEEAPLLWTEKKQTCNILLELIFIFNILDTHFEVSWDWFVVRLCECLQRVVTLRL